MKRYRPHVRVFFTELSIVKHSKKFPHLASKRDNMYSLLYNIIYNGQKQKKFINEVPPRIATFFIFFMLNWFYMWYQPEGPRNIDALVEDVRKLVFNGILLQ